MSKFIVFLSLGSNIGNRSENLEIAIELIRKEIGEITDASPVYKTAAWGITNQPDFYNQVIKVRTDKFPWKVMNLLLQIEEKMGRVRKKKWHKRLIDLDILFFNDIILLSENLIVPHPFISKRMFVLKPLSDIEPELNHPILNKNISQLIDQCHDTTALSVI